MKPQAHNKHVGPAQLHESMESFQTCIMCKYESWKKALQYQWEGIHMYCVKPCKPDNIFAQIFFLSDCRQEITQFSTYFTAVDKDGDQVLSKSELQAAAKSLGLTAT